MKFIKHIIVIFLLLFVAMISGCTEKYKVNISVSGPGKIMINDEDVSSSTLEYKKNTNVTLKAVADSEGEFISWMINESVVSNELEYTLHISDTDIELKAIFTKKGSVNKYTITLLGDNDNYENLGGLSIGTNEVASDKKITVVAKNNQNLSFLGWFEGDKLLTTNYSYTFTVNSNKSIEPKYSEKVVPIVLAHLSESGSEVTIYGIVYQVTKVSFLVGDDTAKMLVYCGSNPNVSVGDKVTVKGKIGEYASSKQITNSPKPEISIVTSNNNIDTTYTEQSFSDIENYISKSAAYREDSWYGMPVKVTGSFHISEGSNDRKYYNVYLEGNENVVISLAYPIDSLIDGFSDGDMVSVTGYLYGYTSSSTVYVQLLTSSITKINDYSLIDILETETPDYVSFTGTVIAHISDNIYLVKDGNRKITTYLSSSLFEIQIPSIVKFTGYIEESNSDTLLYSTKTFIANYYQHVDTTTYVEADIEPFDEDKMLENIYRDYNNNVFLQSGYSFSVEGVVTVAPTVSDGSSVAIVSYGDFYFVFLTLSISNVQFETGDIVTIYGYQIESYTGGLISCHVYNCEKKIVDSSKVINVSRAEVGDQVTITGTVYVKTTTGLYIGDETGYALVYLGEEASYSLGTEITVTGTVSNYGGVNQIASNPAPVIVATGNINETVYPIAKEFDATSLRAYTLIPENYRVNNWGGIYVSIVGTYNRVTSADGTRTYHNISVSGLYDYYVSLASPLSEVYSGLEVGDTIRAFGFLSGITSSSYIQLVTVNAEPFVDEQNDVLTIYSLNDLHGSFDEGEYNASIANIGQYLLDKKDDLSVILAAGDMFQGTALSSMTRGEIAIEIMNIIGFDAMSAGNHEFDWGIDVILKYFDKSASTNTKANFPFLVSNVLDTRTNQLAEWATPYTVVTKGKYKVGIVGIIGHEQTSSILASVVKNYRFTDESEAIKKYTQILRTEEKCDFVIASCHFDSSSINNTIANLSGDYFVDAVINGHTHQYYNGEISRNSGGFLPYIQSGDYGRYIGVIKLEIDKNTKKVVDVSTSNISTKTECTNTNQDILNVFTKYQSYVDIANEKLGVAGVDIYQSDGAVWAADVLKNTYDADFGVVNSGGIRGLGFPIYAGEEINYGSIFEISPFENAVVVLQLQGRYIKSAMNISGLVFNSDAASLIDDNKIYKVATIDYVHEKTNYPFQNATSYEAIGVIFRDILAEDVRNRCKDGATFVIG